MYFRKIGEAEEKFIRDNLEVLTLNELAKELNVSKTYICDFIKQNKMKKKYVFSNKCANKEIRKGCRSWTEEELKFLKENYSKLQAKEIASVLNRSYTSIMAKVKALGLHKRF